MTSSAINALVQEANLQEKLDELLPRMGAEKIPDRHGAQQEWQKICFEAGAPGNDALRAEVCALMIARLGKETPVPARVILLTQLERIGREESVDALAAQLSDGDRLIRDGVRRALTNNPSAKANAALIMSMQGAGDATFKAGLINSLGYRADESSVGAVAKELGHRDQAVAGAAARALGKIATDKAAQALAASRIRPRDELRLIMSDAYLLCADKLLAAGKKKEAMAIYAAVNKPDEPKSIRLAAAQGLLNAARAK